MRLPRWIAHEQKIEALPGGGGGKHEPRVVPRTAEDLIAERDDAALRYFLRRTLIKGEIGEQARPRLCTYCGSSGIVVTVKVDGQRVLISKLQDVGEDKEILCLHCHRIWQVKLVGWE